jgi:signal transduction histidine kinase
MGPAVKFSSNRTALALVLTGLAVILPSAAWYLVGSRELERQMTEVADASQEEAQETVRRIASQLTRRLHALLQAEAQRPFYHYQAYFHDPKGAYEGASVVPSPLASGPSDPLVEAYFQADVSSGRLTMPAMEFEIQQSDPNSPRSRHLDQEVLYRHQLENGLASLLDGVRGESVEQTPPGTQAFGQRVDVLDAAAWQQNVSAADLYRGIKSRTITNQPPSAPVTNQTGSVKIFVGPMKWHTIYIGTDPALAALREVVTPQGATVQGFVVSAKAIANIIKAARLPAKFLPGHPKFEYQAAVNVGEDPWRVAIDITDARVFAVQQASDLRRTFLTIFSGGVAVAVLSGLAVVWLVWQSEQLARQRSQFAASAAHELRTPLAGLRIYSEMLAEGLGEPGKARQYAHRVAEEAERLGRVVTNVLSFTRLERGMLKVTPTPGDLAVVVRECVARQQPALTMAGTQVEVEIAGGLPPVRFDRDAVTQILQNLLDNAEKHTRNAADRSVRVSLARHDGAVALTVRDHGPGLPEEVRQNLFEPFTRGEDNHAPAGLGLGLALVQAQAHAQGAEINYADAPGGGAQFTVTFSV